MTFAYSVTTGPPELLVTLKKPPTLTWPVLKVVAARIMVSLTPADRELSRMSKAVTPAIAVARKKVRRLC